MSELRDNTESLLNQFKQNEISFQNRKYSKDLRGDDYVLFSPKEYEQKFLTPIEFSGIRRGTLFRNSVRELGVQTDLAGKKILDYACGRGTLGVYLAQKGGIVSGFDISPVAIQLARTNADINRLNIDFKVMDATNLGYPDCYFDYIIGFEALHHVIIFPNTLSELARIIRKGGKVVFAENWGADNCIFQIWRKITTLRKNKSFERGEIILSKSVFQKYHLQEYFSKVEIKPTSFLYMGKGYFTNPTILRTLYKLDSYLINRFPNLEFLYGEAVIVLQR